MNLADILKEYRIKNRVSQGYIARKTNLDRTTISKLESGERRKPTKETLKKLSNGLKIDFDILVNAAGYEIEEKDYPFNYTIVIEGRYSTFGSDPDEAIKNARELIDETMYSIIGKSEQFDNVTNGAYCTIYTSLDEE